jgi:hypothetical protein
LKHLEIGQTVSVLANVGVLAGLHLLVYELNQNRQMMEAQTRHEVSQGIVNQLGELASNAELAELEHIAECGRAFDSPVDESRFFYHINSRMRYWEDVHYQYRRGLYDESEFVAQREAWRAFIRPDMTRANWARMKGGFSTDFASEIDALIAETDSSQFMIPGCE